MADAQQRMVSRWAESFQDGHDAVMLAVGRRDVATLNQLARAELRRSGQLGPDLLQTEGMGFAAGDKVICLRNDRRLDVLNGTMGVVERVAGGSLVINADDGMRALPTAYLAAGHLDHAYAMTVHKSQGMTVEQAFVLSSESLSQESGYVAMSRATESTELFVPLGSGGHEPAHGPRRSEPADPIVDLTRQLQTSRAKQLALFEVGANEPTEGEESRQRLNPYSVTSSSDSVSAGLYGARQAVRELTSGVAVRRSEVSEHSGSTDGESEIDRLLRRSRQRIEAHLVRNGLSRQGEGRQLDGPDRSRGLGR
jgi:hypothetical protein